MGQANRAARQLAFALMLPALFDIAADRGGLQKFIFDNASDHLEIIQAILKQKNVSLPVRVLDPVNTDDRIAMENWLELHQQAHNDFNGVLGIAGNDIGTVDFNNRNQVKAWLWIHAEEHQNARQVLGI